MSEILKRTREYDLQGINISASIAGYEASIVEEAAELDDYLR